MLHSIVYGFSCVKLPNYIISYEGSGLRKSHLDHNCYVSRIMPRNNNAGKNFEYNYSLFYRVHLSWNRLPINIREIFRSS